MCREQGMQEVPYLYEGVYVFVLFHVVLGAGVLQDAQLQEGLGDGHGRHGAGRGDGRRYHGVEALRQLVVQLHVVHLHVQLALVLRRPHLEPQPLLELSPQLAPMRSLHPLVHVVDNEPALDLPPGRGRLSYGELPAVDHEVLLDGAALGGGQGLVALLALIGT